jgi:hypothetical protein
MSDLNPEVRESATANDKPATQPEAVSATEFHTVEINQQEKASIEAAKAASAAKATQQETLDAVKKSERIALLIAGIVAVATIGQWITSCNNNASTSIQTDKLICAANKNAAAADKFRIAAEGINVGVGNAVGKLEAQAGSTEKAASAAKSAAQTSREEFVSSQRAWIDLEVHSLHRMVGTPIIDVNYTLNNVGHSIARNISFSPHFILPGQATGHECERPQEVQRQMERVNGGFVIFAGKTANIIQMAVFPNVQLIPNKPRPKLIACVAYKTTVDTETHYTKLTYFLDDAAALDSNSTIENIAFHIDAIGTYAN